MPHPIRTALLLTAVFLLQPASSVVFGQEPAPASVEAKSKRLFELKKTISAESAAWEEQKRLFEGLTQLRESEIGKIDEFTASAEKRIEEVKKKRAELDGEETARQEWRTSFDERLAELEEQLRPLLVRFPPPLRLKVEESALRLEENDPETPLQDRFRDVITILGATLEFQNRITVDAGLREVEGESVEVDTIYLGLSQAFYVSRTGKSAGTGIPTDEGWVWTENPSLAASIRNAIAVQQREAPPIFVELPVGGTP